MTTAMTVTKRDRASGTRPDRRAGTAKIRARWHRIAGGDAAKNSIPLVLNDDGRLVVRARSTYWRDRLVRANDRLVAALTAAGFDGVRLIHPIWAPEHIVEWPVRSRATR